MTTELEPNALARLAFWAKGMVLIDDARQSWPGFSYGEGEWRRLRELGGAVPGPTYRMFVLVNAAVFIAIAAFGIGAVFIPLATLLFPVPAETSALKFSMLLAGCSLLIIGLGLPLSLRAAAALVTGEAIRTSLAPALGDGALASKIAWQINRITLVMCGLLVPGMLIWITYDIHAGPLVTALKWIAIAAMGASTALGVRGRRRSPAGTQPAGGPKPSQGFVGDEKSGGWSG